MFTLRHLIPRTGFGVAAAMVLNAAAVGQNCFTNPEGSGDLTGDGYVDVSDITVVFQAYGCIGTCACGDANGDGRVNLSDVALVVYDMGCPERSDDFVGPIGAHGVPSGGIDFDVRRVNAPDHVSDPLAPEFAGGITHHVFDLDADIDLPGEYVLALEFRVTDPAYAIFQHPAGGPWFPFPSDPNACDECEARDFDTYSVQSQSLSSNGLHLFFWNYSDADRHLLSGWHSWFQPAAGKYWIQRVTLETPQSSGFSFVRRAPSAAGIAWMSLSAVTIGCDPETVARVDFEITRCERMADLNLDHWIDLSDLSILLSHFGTLGGATHFDGDIDFDGDVDLSDLSRLLANFGLECI